MSRRSLLIFVLWLIGIGIALILDRSIAQRIHDAGWDRAPLGLNNKHWFIEVLKFFGQYPATLIAVVLLLAFYRKRSATDATPWEAAGLVAAAGALTGLISLLKWIIGRRRPVAGIDPFNIELFIGGVPGLLGAESNLSFPSGHSALAFANASALALLLPRWRWPLYALAAITAAERIAENAHYVSDNVVGAAVGCLATWTVVRLFQWTMRRRQDRLTRIAERSEEHSAIDSPTR